MSAEPLRRKAYSTDLRWRIVWQRIAMGLTFRNVASNLSISIGTVHNIYKLFEQTGEVDPKKPCRRPEQAKLDSYYQLLIIGIVLENPTMYLGEVCQLVQEVTATQISPSTICKLLAMHGLSRKKIQQVAIQRSVDYRAQFMVDVSHFASDMFVWVDETSCDRRDMFCKFGYSFRSERATSRRLFARGRRISAIAALCSTGLLDVEVTMDNVNGDKFFDFIRSSLIPKMHSFDGISARSIIVMDNCAIHHVQPVIDVLHDVGILLMFLPPYSPDYNPIELAFADVKRYLKQHEGALNAFPDLTVLVKSAFQCISAEKCQAWITHCKY